MINLKEKTAQIGENLHSLALPVLKLFAKPEPRHIEKITPRQFTNILEKHHAHPVATIKADKHTTFRIIE